MTFNIMANIPNGVKKFKNVYITLKICGNIIPTSNINKYYWLGLKFAL
jgi:hypothetical protein